jgi:four helix bundle protein
METAKIKSFTDLRAWQEGHQLVLLVYSITELFPQKEMFVLVSQIRRCAISITSNIAEGFSRRTNKDKIYFYSIAQGSLTELQNQLLVARDVGYLEEKKFKEAANQTIVVGKLISGLKKVKNTKY